MMIVGGMSLSPHIVRALAVIAETSPATARRFLEGLPVRDLQRERLVRACARLGLVPQTASEVAALHDRKPEAGR